METGKMLAGFSLHEIPLVQGPDRGGNAPGRHFWWKEGIAGGSGGGGAALPHVGALPWFRPCEKPKAREAEFNQGSCDIANSLLKTYETFEGVPLIFGQLDKKASFWLRDKCAWVSKPKHLLQKQIKYNCPFFQIYWHLVSCSKCSCFFKTLLEINWFCLSAVT